MKIKEIGKRDWYFDCFRELKKCNVTLRLRLIPIVIDALGTIPKELVRGLEVLKIKGRAETTQTTALLRLA